MSFSDIFKKSFLTSYTNSEITFQHAVIAMLICVIISTVVGVIYYFKMKKYFFSKEFAVSIVALAVITAAVILTIQSSIVVSLGMVGALSIVRFRTAIKNPLDLVFLFWAITVGIVCGTGLYYIAVALTLMVGIITLLSDEIPGGVSNNKILVLDGTYPYDQEQLKVVLKKHTKYWSIRTESVHNESVNLIIEVKGVKNNNLVKEIRDLDIFQNVSLIVQEGTVN